MRNIPLKMRVMEWLKDHPGSSMDDIMIGLRPEYGHEGQFNKTNFHHMMQAMRAVGIIQNASVELDEQENVVLRYQMTNYGIHSMKHIPKE